MGGIGFVLGAGLSYASKKFAVEKNAKVEEIIAILPGANCGGCAYPGCAGYADAIVMKGAPANMCAPGGAAAARKIANILGLDEQQTVRKAAYLHCAGSRDKAKDKYIYNGIRDCQMAVLLGGGPKAC